METLLELYNKHKKGDWPDKNSTHSYISVYEEILAPYRHTAKNILEIGLMSGESLRMWSEYFSGTVYGMDCSETPIDGLADLRPIMAEGKYNICIGDATSEFDVARLFGDIKWNLVIDDGSHNILDQLKTVEIFRSRMVEGGMIILEDIQDIDRDRHVLKEIACCGRVQILDRRSVKGRYDDVICLISF